MNTAAADTVTGPVTAPRSVTEAIAIERFNDATESAAGRQARRSTVARYRLVFADLTGWGTASLCRRLGVHVDIRTLVAFLLTALGIPVDARYVRASGSWWGHHAADANPQFAVTFHSAATTIGFSDVQAGCQWRTLAKISVTTGIEPQLLPGRQFQLAVDALTAAHTGPTGKILTSWSTPLHGLKATLSSLGALDHPGSTRLSPSTRIGHWQALAVIAPLLVETLRRYLAQITVSMRPGSVELIDTTLRHFAVYLTEHHPDVLGIADVRRTHIEGFKTFLTSKAGYRGKREPAKTTTGMRLGHLRGMFDRIIECDYPDAPPRNPIFAGDMPIRDRPLPRFLDDAKAAALLTAARNLPTLFERVAVEVLARTGLRKGEFIGLTRDAMTQIGDGRWLRTPVGKLHTDRYIPLHPRVEELLQQWLSANPQLPNSTLMFTDHGRPIPGRRVDNAVYAAAGAAGIGHVTPHQLRHTMATQAINNGMSLEAIAALLGHASMSMTMTYARISDRTVAAEYFAVTGQVEALYSQSEATPADNVEGPNMRRLRAETTRLLGNGHCTRPAVLDCRYETICESCTHFATSEDHRQTLTNQLGNATDRGEPHRQKVYLELITRLGSSPA
ncbi:tyrosine-type recombinase/integrase [Nakamurella sp. GG22]